MDMKGQQLPVSSSLPPLPPLLPRPWGLHDASKPGLQMLSHVPSGLPLARPPLPATSVPNSQICWDGVIFLQTVTRTPLAISTFPFQTPWLNIMWWSHPIWAPGEWMSGVVQGPQDPMNMLQMVLSALPWDLSSGPGVLGQSSFGVCVMYPLTLHSHRSFLSLGSACAWLLEDSWLAVLFSAPRRLQEFSDGIPGLGCRWETHFFPPCESHLFFLAGSFSDSVFDLGVEKFYLRVPWGVCYPSILHRNQGGLSFYRCRLFFQEMLVFVIQLLSHLLFHFLLFASCVSWIHPWSLLAFPGDFCLLVILLHGMRHCFQNYGLLTHSMIISSHQFEFQKGSWMSSFTDFKNLRVIFPVSCCFIPESP